MTERKNNSFSATAFIVSDVVVRAAGPDHQIASTRINVLSRSKDKKYFASVQAWDEIGDLLVEAGNGARIDIKDAYLTTDEWEDKDTGERRSKDYLTITEFEIISHGGEKAPANKAQTSRPSQQGRDTQQKGAKAPYVKKSYGKTEDIPF